MQRNFGPKLNKTQRNFGPKSDKMQRNKRILNFGFKIFNFEYVKFGESSTRGDYNKAKHNLRPIFRPLFDDRAAAVLIVDGGFGDGCFVCRER